MKRTVPFVLCAILGFMTYATTPSVTDVVAKQRYPWNGLVDITCKVSGFDGTAGGFQFIVAVVESGNVRNVSHVWVVRNAENSSDLWVDANGDYRLLWDAKADLGEVVYDNMIVRVTIDNKVQLWEDGPYWATTNIGADRPWEYGLYFWWGDTKGYRLSADGKFSFNFASDNSAIYTFGKSVSELQSAGWVTSDGVLALKHDAAHVHWGGAWRMPTYQELYDLFHNKCDWTWTTMNGAYGFVVRGRGDYATNSIFLPGAGFGLGTSHSYSWSGFLGSYWSSVPSSDSVFARGMTFFDGYQNDNNNDRYFGQSVRPVQGFTK